ncbi:MAG: 4-(cytidine 5'-diphospho)-2-C-methyl-D-erythritol kinase [Chloroflexi bacterium]|nr:4-(cytidine 5'-diphospho)-2-C-methyl-D-erythritol kinase [Chloroflexota bacterium]
MLIVLAPAKLNLTLEVLAKRDDGFHEIRSVIQAINLCDSFSFQSGDGIEFKCDLPDWVAAESLVSRAAGLLRQASGGSQGASIEISKRIPLLSGLGGDSSDAAATLRGLNQLWELGLSPEELLELAWQLGSDVAFFLYGGTALVEGRGEIITPLPPLPHRWVILALPPVPRLPGKTRRLYHSLKASHYTDGQITQRLVEELKAGRGFSPSLLFNTFENVAFSHFSELGVSRSHMEKMGARHVHLAGSGPALFTLVEHKAQAEEFYTLLQRQRLAPYLAETLDAIDRVE